MTRRFPIRVNPWKMTLAILFFVVCFLVFVHEWLHPGGGLIIEGLVRLGPDGASTFYLVLALLSLGLILMGLAGVLYVVITRPEIVIEDDTITIPRPLWRGGTTTIRFADVREVSERSLYGQVYITLFHPGGKASIGKEQVGDAYHEIVSLIRSRLE